MEQVSYPDYRIVSTHEIAEVRQHIATGQNGLFALVSYLPGQLIADFSASTIAAEPTYLTVQVGIRKHIMLQPEFLQYINHSCDPNVFFDTHSMQLIALKPLSPGQELVFFYPSTEWKMVQGFHCYCGTASCAGQIRGAAFLSDEILRNYALTEFIKQQMARRAARKRVA